MEGLIEWIRVNPEYLLGVIYLITTAESLAVVGIVVPGVAALLAITALAGNLDVSVVALLVVGVLGAITGDGLSYWFGRLFKDKLPNYKVFQKHPEWIDNGEYYFQKYGAVSILLARFIGFIRPFVPMVAGMFNMPIRSFMTWNIISASLWAPIFLLPGYYFGAHFDWQKWATHPAFLIGMSILTLAALGITKFLHAKKTEHSK